MSSVCPGVVSPGVSVEPTYLVNSTDSSLRAVPAFINLSIKLGVPLVPSQIYHLSGIFLVLLNIIMEPLGKKLVSPALSTAFLIFSLTISIVGN
nr:MAG TPA: hypothetical protein [Crassvirales sp.]